MPGPGVWQPDMFTWIRYSRNNRLVPLLGLSWMLAGCGQEPPTAENDACLADGYLRVGLHGAIRADIEWGPADLSCEGMPRPEGLGARLRFSGTLGDSAESRPIAIILGVPDLEMAETGSELPTNVTLIEEGAGRFFGTQDTAGCWTDIEEQQTVDDLPGDIYRIAGKVYCVSPLAELNGGSSINFTELSFAGRLDWATPE